MLVVSHPMQLENHIAKSRDNPRSNLISHCGQRFSPYPDCDLEDLDSLEFTRLCEKCLQAIKAARLPLPRYEGKVWSSI